MGIVNGANKMQWLFTGTFAAMLLLIPLFGYVTQKFAIKRVMVISYWFFMMNIVVFYIGFKLMGYTQILAISFFIWLSVFNLFVISLFWSFMSDVYISKTSKRVFGFIAAGGSLGALFGPFLSSFLIKSASIGNLLIVAFLFLSMALFSIKRIIRIRGDKGHIKAHGLDGHMVIKQRLWILIKDAAKIPLYFGHHPIYFVVHDHFNNSIF